MRLLFSRYGIHEYIRMKLKENAGKVYSVPEIDLSHKISVDNLHIEDILFIQGIQGCTQTLTKLKIKVTVKTNDGDAGLFEYSVDKESRKNDEKIFDEKIFSDDLDKKEIRNLVFYVFVAKSEDTEQQKNYIKSEVDRVFQIIVKQIAKIKSLIERQIETKPENAIYVAYKEAVVQNMSEIFDNCKEKGNQLKMDKKVSEPEVMLPSTSTC
jgi:hypothetical protein